MSDPAREEFETLGRQWITEPLHVAHVTRLALQLFDELKVLHSLGERERLLLEAAGFLHDIGHQYDYLGTGHHKESARMIREHDWKHFLPEEVEIVAQVARYHRKSMPSIEHAEFAALPEDRRRIVQHLAALLRLADSLDRSHERYVTAVSAEVWPNRIVFHLEASGPVRLEVTIAHKKGDLASAVFQRDLVFMTGDEVITPERFR